ncbi:hypothetical protein LTR70_006158 [Exophiala xenobiotica]|uniref:Uncharacterized protein n=1 Tax=Lithohypha guttulata TaxID=1690604 RepID=A0ABR0K7R9_9EURO|nr:hypothetical protein LTR24_005836 [Lithohypha guttulata]KAK5316609.1 hypothetical protein LTR70_006158 [Exophiala xenobiotica]
MAPITFSTAVLIFINLWLIALTTFGTAAGAIFLHVLGAVDNNIGASVTVSILCSVLSFVYLILQSIISSSNRPKSWLARATVHLPKILIVCWIVTATVGLVKALSSPLCQSGDVKGDAAAWQAGLGCWVYRVLVSLNVVMLVLIFSVFILLEINGRHVPIGLFHFEYTTYPTHHRDRRRTLVSSAYGSTETLTRPLTTTSEDEHTLALSAEKRANTRSRGVTLDRESTVSPSPTYRTFELNITGRRTRTNRDRDRDRSLNTLDEESILALSSSRQSTCTTATLSTLPLTQLQLQFPSISMPPMPAATHPHHIDSPLFASGHLTSRPLSNIPSLPTPTTFQLQLRELERLKAEHTATAKSKSIAMPPQSPTKANRPALYSNASKSDLKSSCALPLSSGTGTTANTPAGSMDLTTALNLKAPPSRPRSEDLEAPPPEWCPAALKERSAPLSADPAIRRLTEMGLRGNRASTRVSRRLSFSGFEFGFGGRGRGENGNGAGAGGGTETWRSVSGGTPANVVRMGKEKDGKCETRASATTSRAGAGADKENDSANVNANANLNLKAKPDASREPGTATDKKSQSQDKDKHDKIMNRHKPLPAHRKRSTTTLTTTKGANVSLFPPVAPPPPPPASKKIAAHERKESSAGGGGGGGSRKRGKSMVERGRYEKLPR